MPTARQQKVLDPVLFARKLLGDDPWEVPMAISRALEKPRARVAVKGCHSSSKTYNAARFVLWFITRFKDGIVVTTAPTDRQVQDIMWGEIRMAMAKAKIPFKPGTLTSVTVGIGNYAEGFTTSKGEQAVRFQGYHAPHLLFVLDEAPGIPPEILPAIEGAAAGGDVRVLMLGNPTIPGGPFYDAFTANRERWETFTIDAYDMPNFDKLRELAGGDKERMTALLRALPVDDPALAYAPRPYLATPIWARERLMEWGEKSPFWQARVRGQFPEQAEDALISLAWLEKSRSSWGGFMYEPRFTAGIDVAGPGEDETSAVIRNDQGAIVARATWATADPRGEVLAFLNPYRKHLDLVNVDSIGIGYNFGLHLQDHGLPVELVNVSEASNDKEKFANAKAEFYWGLRMRFEAGEITGLTDEVTISQLASIKYKHNPRGQIQIESKEDARKRGVKSPDRAESVMLAFAASTPGIIDYYRGELEREERRKTAIAEGRVPEEEPSEDDLIKIYEEAREEFDK